MRDNLRRISREPALFITEVAWRWLFGASSIVLLVYAILRLHAAIEVTPEEQAMLTSWSPQSMGQALAEIGVRALPLLIRFGAIIVPAIAVLWILAATVGRAAVMTRLCRTSNVRWGSLIAIHILRVMSVFGLVLAYLGAAFAASLALNPESPNLLLATVIFVFLFAWAMLAWGFLHWILSLASIYPVSEAKGTAASLGAAIKLVRTHRSELASIASPNATGRTLAAIVFTALALVPLPLLTVTPALFWSIEVFLTLVYCLVSDFLLLARLAAYADVVMAQRS